MLKSRPFDFVIGSVHFVDGADPYDEEYWRGKTERRAYLGYLERIYECIRIHDDFDVLGHLTYVSRSVYNPTKNLLEYRDYSDICDEIMKTVADKGKGMEINTSGVDRVGDFLPSLDFIRRFRELGGEIVTVGSDAHDDSRMGQYVDGAIEIAREVFGYVCTFEGRRAVYHDLNK